MKRILLFVCTATCCVCQMLAQSFTPIPAAKYQILNAACGYALAYADGQCTIAEVDPTDEHQLWLVESDGTDYFYLVNLAENTCLALGTGNAWNCVFYTDEELANAGADRGLYTIEDLASGNVGLRLKSNGKYLGLDNLSPGSWAFLDKQVSNYGEWQLVALGTEAADAYDAKVASVENYLETQFADNYNAIFAEAYDLLADIQDNVIYTDEGYASAIERLNDLQSQLRTVLPVLADIETQYARMTDLVETPTDYPGRVAFERTYETISETYEAINDELRMSDASPFLALIQQAIDDYLNSRFQVEGVSEENPLDVTFAVSAPSFREEEEFNGSHYTLSTAEWVVNKQGSSGWEDYKAVLTDKHPSGPITAYNAWMGSIKTLGISQTLASLPEGRYFLTCEAYTDQPTEKMYAFVQNSTGVKLMSQTDYEALPSWATLQTPVINVTDGQLTIGFETVKAEGGNAAGWFQVTNFRLYYVGSAASDAAYQNMRSILADTKEVLCTLRGDSARLVMSIANAELLTPEHAVQEIEAAIQSMKDAAALAATSNAAFAAFTAGTHAQLKALEPVEGRTEYNAAIARVLSDIDALVQADTTTYHALAPFDAVLADLQTWAKTIAYEETIRQPATPEGTDFTALLVNPRIQDGTTGWTIDKGNGNALTNKGQSYDGDANNAYLDSWNGTAGALNYHAFQTLADLPNGTYRLRFKGRGNGDGITVYATSAADTVSLTLTTTGDRGGSLYEENLRASALNYLNSADNTDYPGYSVEDFLVEIEGAEQAYLADYGLATRSTGWSAYELDDIMVSDHSLTIGVTTDSLVSGNAFTGTWFSADDFELYYVVEGDNRDFNFTTGISGPSGILPDPLPVEYYSPDGRRLASPQRGLNLVRMGDGTVRKLLLP